MTTLVVGASGATGRLVVEQLIFRGQKVKIIVRSASYLPDSLKQNSLLTITEASLLELTDAELLQQVQGCHADVSCLGHNLTFKGMFGHPKRLVTDATKRICEAIEKNSSATPTPVKYILMSTAGNQNKLAGETVSKAQSFVIFLLRHLLPPHADNEEAAAYLQTNYGDQQKVIEWIAVRPDGLIDSEIVTEYKIKKSPTRSAIFDAGKTFRINVAHFMTQLVLDKQAWKNWKHQMPVIYDV